MNDIKIVTLFKLSFSYSIMAEGVGCVVDSENGSFNSQITCRLPRKASQAAISAWKISLCKEISKRRPASWGSKTVHTVSQQVYANEEKDCNFYRGKCHERVKVSS